MVMAPVREAVQRASQPAMRPSTAAMRFFCSADSRTIVGGAGGETTRIATAEVASSATTAAATPSAPVLEEGVVEGVVRVYVMSFMGVYKTHRLPSGYGCALTLPGKNISL